MRHNFLDVDNCLKCTDCNAACPVRKVHPGYPGPKFLGPELERIRREGIPCDTEWLEFCTGCGGCDIVCPNQVEICEMIAAAKAELKKSGIRALRDRLLSRPALVGRFGVHIPRAVQGMMKFDFVRAISSHLLGISAERVLPEYTNGGVSAGLDGAIAKERILYFPGCFVQCNAPEVGRATVDVLRRNGFAVDVGAFRCCGLPAMSNGDREELLKNARHNLQEMKHAIEGGGKIVSGCSSCSLMLKATYPKLLRGTALESLARDVARNTYDLGELLSVLGHQGKLNLQLAALHKNLAYHAPCHIKAQGVGTPWVEVLREIPDIHIVDTDAGCCGMAGTYGFKKEKYPISMKIGATLSEAMTRCAPDVAVTECAMCQEQIRHLTGFETVHPVMILSQAYASADKLEATGK